jgi:hypothetical protein
MAARITSLEVLETFRSALIVFLSAARRSVDEVTEEVRRTRLWLQHDQRMHWEGQIRRRQKLLDAAVQELFSARLSGAHMSTSAKEMAVRKAKQAVAEAEEKLRNVKRWNRDFDHKADPLVKRLESLRFYLDYELPKGVSFLSEAQKILEAYVTSAPAPAGPPPPTDPAPAPASD